MNETKNTISIKAREHSRGFQISGLRGYILSIGIGGGHYCENYNKSWDACGEGDHPTSTMEVAVLRDGSARDWARRRSAASSRDGGDCHFVCLPYDVAGYVPVANLSQLIDAVKQHDWKRVCSLCGEDDSDSENKFPKEE